jgi:hypothetical protein
VVIDRTDSLPRRARPRIQHLDDNTGLGERPNPLPGAAFQTPTKALCGLVGQTSYQGFGHGGGETAGAGA